MICGVLSVIGITLWYATKIGNLAIAFNILADGLATLPTIVKSYKYPETERAWPWLFAVASGMLTLVTVRQWNFGTVGFSLYYSIAMFFVFFFIQTKIGKHL